MPLSDTLQPIDPAGPAFVAGRGGVLDLAAIESSLREVADTFASINAGLGSRRDAFDAVSVERMMDGYAAIDVLLAHDVDLFSVAHMRQFLELNALVLCGRDPRVRADAAGHLRATEERFFDRADGGIRDIIEWSALHAGESAALRAAGVYIRILSQPELFIEGNHRTGALLISYIMVRGGLPPFVLTRANAKEYLDFSTLFTTKSKTGLGLRVQMPWLKRRFAVFLRSQADPKFLCAAWRETHRQNGFTPPKDA